VTPDALVHRGGPPADLLVRGAHVLDPRTGLDGVQDVLVRDGTVTEVGALGDRLPGVEEVDGRGRHLFPAFVDPHVHLRTPGQEHKEDLDTGTRAAAAGGFGAVIAMPNTDPVVDSGPILRALRDAAAREARVPVGFLPCITQGMRGEQLTEMAALRDLGALGFTDDGRPVTSAGMLRLALQYQRMVGGVLALHEEDPALSGRGAMHEGAVSALLGVAGIPSISESTMVARDAAIAGYEGGRIHVQHLSCVESVQAVAVAKAQGAQITAEVSPHHLTLTDEAVRGLETRMKMNPPLRAESDRQALIDGLRDGTIDCIATDHAPHARDEKEVPFEQAPFGTTGLETAFAADLHRPRAPSGSCRSRCWFERLTAGGGLLGCPSRGSPRGPGRTSRCWTSGPPGRWARTATPRARRTAASPAAPVRARPAVRRRRRGRPPRARLRAGAA
jgi:dihydroorotase